ncbi:MAG: PIN domain nuclease [Steroidobacteraceae bacterium]|nr:PIN domain nuclease [Steroidobacteraceae bacterium]
MIVVDTSVWIDYFNGVPTPQAGVLDELLGTRVLAIGDLILAELLQGFATEQDARRALALLEPLEFLAMGGRDVAIQSAAHYRRLRRSGVTVRKTMDMLIGTYCLMHDHEILHSDRDFDVLAKHLGLKVARC